MKNTLNCTLCTSPSPPSSFPVSPLWDSELGPLGFRGVWDLGSRLLSLGRDAPEASLPLHLSCSQSQGQTARSAPVWISRPPKPTSLNGLSPYKRVLCLALHFLSRSAFQTPLLPPNNASMPPHIYMPDRWGNYCVQALGWARGAGGDRDRQSPPHGRELTL